jgi:hypothetical protein
LASRFALLPAIIFSPMLFDCCVWCGPTWWERVGPAARFGVGGENCLTTFNRHKYFIERLLRSADVTSAHQTGPRCPSVFFKFLTRPNIPAGRTWLSTVAIQRVVGIEEKPNHFLEPLVMIAFTDKSCIVERSRKWKKRLYTLEVNSMHVI